MRSARCVSRSRSRLRAWLLRVSGLPLDTLTYTELRPIIEGKIAKASASTSLGTTSSCTGQKRHRSRRLMARHASDRCCPD